MYRVRKVLKDGLVHRVNQAGKDRMAGWERRETQGRRDAVGQRVRWGRTENRAVMGRTGRMASQEHQVGWVRRAMKARWEPMESSYC